MTMVRETDKLMILKVHGGRQLDYVLILINHSYFHHQYLRFSGQASWCIVKSVDDGYTHKQTSTTQLINISRGYLVNTIGLSRYFKRVIFKFLVWLDARRCVSKTLDVHHFDWHLLHAVTGTTNYLYSRPAYLYIIGHRFNANLLLPAWASNWYVLFNSKLAPGTQI